MQETTNEHNDLALRTSRRLPVLFWLAFALLLLNVGLFFWLQLRPSSAAFDDEDSRPVPVTQTAETIQINTSHNRPSPFGPKVRKSDYRIVAGLTRSSR